MNNNSNHKEQLSKLKGLVNNTRQWNNFVAYIDELISHQHKLMEQTDNVQSMYKAQGAIYQLRRLQMLRDEVLKLG